MSSKTVNIHEAKTRLSELLALARQLVSQRSLAEPAKSNRRSLGWLSPEISLPLSKPTRQMYSV
jgi:hypothetical protein